MAAFGVLVLLLRRIGWSHITNALAGIGWANSLIIALLGFTEADEQGLD